VICPVAWLTANLCFQSMPLFSFATVVLFFFLALNRAFPSHRSLLLLTRCKYLVKLFSPGKRTLPESINSLSTSESGVTDSRSALVSTVAMKLGAILALSLIPIAIGLLQPLVRLSSRLPWRSRWGGAVQPSAQPGYTPNLRLKALGLQVVFIAQNHGCFFLLDSLLASLDLFTQEVY